MAKKPVKPQLYGNISTDKKIYSWVDRITLGEVEKIEML